MNSQLYKDRSLQSYSGLKRAWETHQIVDFIIRNKALEADFLTALGHVGIILPADKEEQMRKRESQSLIKKRYLLLL